MSILNTDGMHQMVKTECVNMYKVNRVIITNFMVKGPSLQANNRSEGQDNTNLMWNPKAYYRVHMKALTGH
jgi:hypothetical protein